MSVNFQNENESPKFQIKKYIDIDMDFGLNPFTKDIMMKKGDASIKQSVKNLVLGRLGERPFQPNIGSQVYNVLFDNIEPQTTTVLQTTIENVINTFEPRVSLNSVECIPDHDNYGYAISIIFTLINDPETIIVDFYLEWLR